MERDERPSTRSRTARRRRAVRFAAIAFGFAAAAAAVLVAWNLLLSLRIGRFPEIPSEEAIFRYLEWMQRPFFVSGPPGGPMTRKPKPAPPPVPEECLPRSRNAEEPEGGGRFEQFVPRIAADAWFIPAATQLVERLASAGVPRREPTVTPVFFGVGDLFDFTPSWCNDCFDWGGEPIHALLADSPTREDLVAVQCLMENDGKEWLAPPGVDRIEEDGSPVLFRAILAYNPLVFHVPADSAVTNLTLAQLRSIFLDRKRTWREAGVDAPGRVYAYERDECDIAQRLAADWLKGTGSLERLNYDAPARRRSLSAILRDQFRGAVAYEAPEMVPFRAHPGAIGFSLLTQAAPFVRDGTVRLLAVDGAEPTAENIACGRYPVGRALEFIGWGLDSRPRGRDLALLCDYLLSEPGRRLIESAGFLPAPSWAPLPPIRENGDCDALAYAFLHLY